MDAVMAFRDHLAAMLRRPSDSLSKVPQASPKREKLARPKWTKSPQTEQKEKKNSQKMNERGGNVYENKGQVFHSLVESWNLIEN
jgi:hypothetical protein